MIRSSSCATETLEDEEFPEIDDSLLVAAQERLRLSADNAADLDEPAEIAETDVARPLPRSASKRRGSLVVIEEDDNRVRVGSAGGSRRTSIRPAGTRTMSRESSAQRVVVPPLRMSMLDEPPAHDEPEISRVLVRQPSVTLSDDTPDEESQVVSASVDLSFLRDTDWGRRLRSSAEPEATLMTVRSCPTPPSLSYRGGAESPPPGNEKASRVSSKDSSVPASRALAELRRLPLPGSRAASDGARYTMAPQQAQQQQRSHSDSVANNVRVVSPPAKSLGPLKAPKGGPNEPPVRALKRQESRAFGVAETYESSFTATPASTSSSSSGASSSPTPGTKSLARSGSRTGSASRDAAANGAMSRSSPPAAMRMTEQQRAAHEAAVASVASLAMVGVSLGFKPGVLGPAGVPAAARPPSRSPATQTFAAATSPSSADAARGPQVLLRPQTSAVSPQRTALTSASDSGSAAELRTTAARAVSPSASSVDFRPKSAELRPNAANSAGSPGGDSPLRKHDLPRFAASPSVTPC